MTRFQSRYYKIYDFWTQAVEDSEGSGCCAAPYYWTQAAEESEGLLACCAAPQAAQDSEVWLLHSLGSTRVQASGDSVPNIQGVWLLFVCLLSAPSSAGF